MFAQHRRLQQFRRVIVTISVELQKAVEGAHTTEDATMRTGMNADVVEPGSKVLQVFERHVEHVFLLGVQIGEQLLQVALVSLQRIWRISPLQPEVSLIGPDNIYLRILASFHFIS